jgi:hypothetical protein
VSQGKITSTGLTDGVDCESTGKDHRVGALDSGHGRGCKAQAFLSEPGLLLAMFDAGYFSPTTLPGE